MLNKLACLLLVVIFFTACNNNKSKNSHTDVDTTTSNETPPVGSSDDGMHRSVVGKWRPVIVNMSDMSEADKKTLLDSAIIEFYSDGRFAASLGTKVNNGTFIYDEIQALLTTTTDSNPPKTEKYSVGWEKEKIVLTDEKGTVTMTRQ